jgi:hypothetical protein
MSGLSAQERADAASVGFLREVPSQALTRPSPHSAFVGRAGASNVILVEMRKQPNGTPGKKPPVPSVKVRRSKSLDEPMTAS